MSSSRRLVLILLIVYFNVLGTCECPVCLGVDSNFNPPKEGPNSNQNRAHLGSRHVMIFVDEF